MANQCKIIKKTLEMAINYTYVSFKSYFKLFLPFAADGNCWNVLALTEMHLSGVVKNLQTSYNGFIKYFMQVLLLESRSTRVKFACTYDKYILSIFFLCSI